MSDTVINIVNEADDEPRYVISVAAEIVGVPPHTLRYYERCGIIRPHRSQGNIRLYSRSEVALLQEVKRLMENLGVNLAGVEVILRMQRQIAELQEVKNELEQEIAQLKAQLFKGELRP